MSSFSRHTHICAPARRRTLMMAVAIAAVRVERRRGLALPRTKSKHLSTQSTDRGASCSYAAMGARENFDSVGRVESDHRGYRHNGDQLGGCAAMDFALLPPEINSGRMYTGPGSGPMLAAAADWDGLATELHTAAASYGSVISELSAGPWLGAASAAMTAAAAPYVAWMRSTATQAEQTATQAKAAAAAYEVTFAAMVPPPAIEANRALLQALVATNLFGQNSPAIAATETLYAEMWAQDATAMYGYAGASASATSLPPFIPAPQTTNGTSAAGSTQAAASQLTSTALQGLTSPSTGTAQTTVLDTLGTLPPLEGNALFLPGVAQAGLTPLNTTALFTDLSYDDTETNLEQSLGRTEERILGALGNNGFSLPPGDAVGSGSIRPVMALGPAEVPSVTA